MRFPVPPELLEHARSFTGNPATPRDAVTVALIRPGRDAAQLFLLRRRRELSFAPGFDVFPGGKVEDNDRLATPWTGPDPAAWSEPLGCDPTFARAVVIAAVRETFEETGILFASTSDGMLATFDDATLASLRNRLERGDVALSEVLEEHQLTLRADLLAPWSHWLTPEFEPRRFDTRFLVAVAPRGTSHVMPPEAESGRWVSLANITAAIADESVNMLPPTRTTCSELAAVPPDQLLDIAWSRRSPLRTASLVENDDDYFLEVDLDATSGYSAGV